ncbi:MAG TPA: MFS transporter [Mycobacteriales bacterium]|jgi:MFS family permease
MTAAPALAGPPSTATATAAPAADQPARRPMTSIVVAAALMNAAMAVASGVSTIVVADRLGLAWGGVAATAGIIGTGIGALALTRLTVRRGRGRALAVGYLIGAVGALVATGGAVTDDVAALLIGMLLLGAGNAAAQLSRYAAAELHTEDRRGRAIGAVVWAGAVGAVGGPLLLGATGALAGRLGWAPAAGPFALAIVVTTVAAVVSRWLPYGSKAVTATNAPLWTLLRRPAVRSAFAVLATAQVLMVAVMTAAPVDMHHHGQGLGAVGLVLSAHTLGMFALSPVTGRLVDRLGARPVLVAGLAALALAAGAASAGPTDTAFRAAALSLLGYGWNLCFVGGSTALAGTVPPAERARVEGTVDAAVWGLAAVAGLLSTVVLAFGGYAVLTAAAGLLVLVPAAALVSASRAVPARG